MRMINNCFNNTYPTTDGQLLLADITEHPTPTGAKNVFFLETSCSSNGLVTLNARQLCAVESAARNSPDWQIYILFAANVVLSNQSTAWPLLSELLTYSNVNLRRINMTNYANGTPLETWLTEGKPFESSYATSHISDVLRYLTLYKYGGTYLDLDVVVLKNLDLAGINYSGAESETSVAAGVMNFEPNNYGHEVAEMCIRDLLHNFNGFDWGNNGPGVITRVLQTICATKSPLKMTRDRCYGFKVYPPNAFYAIPWRQYARFFNESQTDQVLEQLKESFVAHVWNKHSQKIKLNVGSKSAYAKLAESHCPKVYTNCGEWF